MQYTITHTTNYSYSEAVPVCHNEVHLTPRQAPYQSCQEHRVIMNPVPSNMTYRMDYFGNELNGFSIHESHRRLTVTATSLVNTQPRPRPDDSHSPTWDEMANPVSQGASPAELDAMQFVFDSPIVKRTQQLADYARVSFPPTRSLLEAVLDLTRRIHEEFEYDPKTTTVHTPLDEVFANRSGVCQDFAHMEIGCLRSLGLPARYVSGYLRTLPPPGRPRLVGVDASHAWLSVYGGELGWIELDPTNNAIPTTDHITLAWGRDYSDVCPIKGVFVGGGEHTMTVAVDMAPVEAN